MKRTILVTGRIGCGKSEVCRILRDNGYAVYDSDSRTKALYASRPDLVKSIEKATGMPFDQLSGIFRYPSRLKALEEVVYPAVLEDFREWRENQGDTAFMESAIALEKEQFKDLFDAVILVKAPAELRHSRNPKAASRDASQNEPQEADWVICNDSTLAALEMKVKEITDTL